MGRTYFEVYPDAQGYFRWRLIAANNEIVAASEAYTTRQAAANSAARVATWASGASINHRY
jgi:uncharacterized protein